MIIYIFRDINCFSIKFVDRNYFPQKTIQVKYMFPKPGNESMEGETKGRK